MVALTGEDVYWQLLGQCAQCGKCTAVCPSLTDANMSMGHIAGAMLEAAASASSKEQAAQCIIENGNLVQAVRGCFLCANCQGVCFANNDITQLIYAARKDFFELGLIPREAWSSVLVDQEWDIFTAYRAIHGIGYADLTRHVSAGGAAPQTDCEVAFFPGCSLAAYAPELTREVFATIEQLGGKTTMIDHCCASPLRSAGYYDRAAALCNRIVDEILASGAKTVLFVCPGCKNAIQATIEARGLGIVAQNLPDFLIEHGFAPKRDAGAMDLGFSKSCQDRDGTYMQSIYRVLGVAGAATTVFSGCCGAGGAVSAFDSEQQASQVSRKLSQVPDGRTIVSICPTCTYTYAFDLMQRPRNIGNKNYLELLFESQFDWDTVFYQLGSMWTGEYGEWLAQVFA